jgi:hypothetical protein
MEAPRITNQIVTNNNFNCKVNLFEHQLLHPRRLFTRHNHDRYSSDFHHETYAAHGVLTTVTPIDYTEEDPLFAGVFCDDWPAWAVPFLHPRFALKWIVVHNMDCVQLVRSCFLSITVVTTSELDAYPFIGYNGGNLSVSSPPSFGSICLFDCNARLKNWSEWSVVRTTVFHNLCGRVSDFSGNIKVAIFKDLTISFALNAISLIKYPLASLESILSHVETGQNLEMAPRLPTLSVPQVACTLYDLFHAGGLYPSSYPQPHFLIPCVFSPSRWVKRCLTTKELLGVKDIPISIIDHLSRSEKLLLSQTPLVPLKCLTAIVQDVFL